MAEEMTAGTKELTLEQTFARLDEITKALEDPQTSLEDSFALYKEGTELLSGANRKIDMVQKQVQVLQQGQPQDENAHSGLDDSLWVE